jgi:hypothetical protein
MQAPELDHVYTRLAQAIDKAGSKSELFLAMLALKLITEVADAAQAERIITSVLQQFQAHEKPRHAGLTPQLRTT